MKTQNKVKSSKSHSSTFGIFNIRKLSVSNNKQKPTNRWHLSAEGFLLLPSALRPHLLEVLGIVAASTIFSSLCSTPVSAASLTLTIPSNFSLDITPGASGVFSKSEPSNINVKTDNSSGYTLSIKAKNSENSNSLLNGSISINNKLNSISESTTEDLFKSDSRFNNSWGYLPSKFNSADNTNFLPGPTTEESILETTEEANETGTDYNISIGAKVDNTISSGSYNNNFIFSAIANEPKSMQSFTAEDCATLAQDDGSNGDNISITLRDIRDNNDYTVAKLKDGKCWMLDNLRINGKTINSTDSDMINGSFTVKSSNDTSVFVSEDNNHDAVYYNNKEDGAYYTWYAATAGSGTTNISSGDAPNSICPKGWRLPRGGRQGVSSNELATLLKAYGGDEFTHNDGQQAIINKLVSPAFPNFTYAGYIGYNSGSLTYYGTGARYWTSTAYSSTNAHGLLYDIDSGALSPNNQTEKRSGRSVRCVADTGPRVTITYHLNSGTGGPASPSTQHSDNSRITLDATIPTRDEYGFVGWCDQYTTSSSCPGKLTRPDKTYEINGQTDLNFYAVWKLFSEVSDKGFLGTMQDFDCDAKLPEINDYGTVTDSRDNNEYKVARLFDGKCWMVENLRLGDDKLQNRTLTSDDTDITASTYTLTPQTAEKLNANGNYDVDALYIDPYHPEYGGYYSWHTATAGTGTAAMSSGNATSSICPKGWKLPTGGSSSSDFGNLVTAYGGNNSTGFKNLSATPVPGFALDGYVRNDSGGGLISRGSYGRYWSSTVYSDSIAYTLGLDSSHADYSHDWSGWKCRGIPIRCVARENE